MTSDLVAPAKSNVVPDWRRVLAVVAHPDDESFALGAVLDAFTRQGADVSVLCLTEGESSSLGEVEDLRAVRRSELAAAARELGVSRATLLRHPDGELSGVPRHLLADDVIDEVGLDHPDGFLVFDSSGVTGHPDHAAATAAAVLAAAVLDLPVLAWTLPSALAARLNEEQGARFTGRAEGEIHYEVPVDRGHQRAACAAHRSQSVPTSVVWRRLDLLGDVEHLLWLRPPTPTTKAPTTRPADKRAVHVTHRGGDRFEISVGGHVVAVDQPHELGGADSAPTATELFIGSLAACIAVNARRYLDRNDFSDHGFWVEADYDLASRPPRVSAVTIRLHLPAGFPESRRNALLAVASRCPVHATLTSEPDVSITIA